MSFYDTWRSTAKGQSDTPILAEVEQIIQFKTKYAFEFLCNS